MKLEADEMGYGFKKLLLLLTVKSRHNGIETEEELAFVCYIERTEPVDNIGNVLECACLRWSAMVGVHHVKVKEGGHEVPIVGEWFDVEAFSSFARRVGVIGENYPFKLFIYPRRWAEQRFIVKRFVLHSKSVLKQYRCQNMPLGVFSFLLTY